VENYIKRARADGRIHAEFKQVSTATGRLSCANPNLQNVPRRDDVRAHMRRLFVAPRGKVLVRADFNQLELRVFAALAGEEKMAEIFAKGGDIHQMTADSLGIDRYAAKTINFLMLYGGGAWKISEEFHIPIDKAKSYIKRYFEMFPGIRHYYEQVLEEAKETKKVTMWTGRERRMDALYAEDWRVRKQGEREAINTPIQGGAVEIVKIAMNDLHYKHKAPMILQVHDELIFEVPAKDGKEYARWVKKYVPKLTTINGVKFPVDVSIGRNWYDMESL
jgi:DNA polymerase-1